MSTALLRITIGAPLIAIAIVAFTLALLFEWIGDLAHTCPPSEKQP
jgi:hypothetical protein